MEEKVIKAGMTGVGTLITYMAGNLSPILYILVLFEAMDYISGIASAAKHGGLSRKEAFWGFLKKVFNFFIIAVAFGFDYIIYEASSSIGISFEWPSLFGVLSICYLVSTEGISILENLAELGITVPFLTTALKAFKDKIENKGGGKDGKEQ